MARAAITPRRRLASAPFGALTAADRELFYAKNFEQMIGLKELAIA